MKIFERTFWEKEDETGVKDLHEDFKIHEGMWYYNRYYDPFRDRDVAMKIRFSFDDPALLNECPFMAKIGLNQDPGAAGKYIGFAYGQVKDRDQLEAWAQKFNFAELIVGLDDDGVIKPDSEIIPIK